MAVLINRTQKNFTMISNSILRDKDLSLKDRERSGFTLYDLLITGQMGIQYSRLERHHTGWEGRDSECDKKAGKAWISGQNHVQKSSREICI